MLNETLPNQQILLRDTRANLHPIFIAPAYRPRTRTPWRLIAQLLLSIGFLLGASMSIQQRAIAEPWHEPQTGTLMLNDQARQDGQEQTQPQPAKLLSTDVEATISGLLADVTFSQTFHNASGHMRDGDYYFPLPDDASVYLMTLKIGERVIQGEIREKREAKKMFEQAKAAGKNAALTQQHRPNIFSQHIANIAPDETLVVTLRYLQPIAYQQGQFQWRLPTTITPRYAPLMPPIGDGSSDIALSQPEQDDALGNDGGQSTQNNSNSMAASGWSLPHALRGPFAVPVNPAFSVNIALDSGFTLSRLDALYHDIHIEKSGQRHQIRLRNIRATMDSDFVLQWAPRPANRPQAAIFTERVDGDDYAMLMVLPPQQTEASAKIPRDITFIIDTSGSMAGPSIEQAKQSLALAIEQLTPEDRFNIIAFESSIQTLYNDLTAANREARDYAKHWIKSLEANGGTEMLPALKAAFNHSDDTQRLKQIVFMTDGAVSNEKALFREIHTSLGDARLFTVGIGSAPNHFFMRKAAQFGRGTFTTIGDTREVAHKTHALFKKLDSATYRDIHIDWQTHAEQYPKKIGELYAGEALLVASHLDSRPEKITVTGHSATGPWRTTINLGDASKSSPGISSHWARQKIEQLEDFEVTGAIDENALKTQVTAIALKHHLMTRFTSFIAIEAPTPGASDARLITQHKPTLQNVPYPQTGTWSNFAWWTGILCFMGYLLMHAIRHEP